MVLERIVAGVLNNVLGDFTDNLDPSQLNVGIWGGNVRLSDLELKETALDVFNLPMKLKVKFGCLNSLIMKIPWNKLYTEPAIINIEGLYIVIVPNRGVVYDEDKARKSEAAMKQKELNALEENRRAKRKAKTKDDTHQDSFMEKLIAQVIKNLQINIKNIHIRYEDKFSNHLRPFSIGITLESLEFQTTNTNFEAIIPKEDMKTFYKLVSLNSLAVYWNYQARIISDLETKEAMLYVLRTNIATKSSKPDHYKYVFGPISMNARLALNQSPELNKFKTPKIDLHIATEELNFGITKFHYQDILYLLEAQERYNVGERYLKYRPHLYLYRGHYKKWYKFCFNCVISDIRRRRKNWNWVNIKKHRQLVKDYREAWLHIRTERIPSLKYRSIIENVEDKLDVFNLNIAREQAEMDIDRLGMIRVEDQAVQTWGSWAKNLFGLGTKSQLSTPKGEIVTQLQMAMTAEEKKKLYAAIDFQENLPPTNYPKEFIENKISFSITKVALVVDLLLNLSFTNLSAELLQRPAARAMHIRSSVKSVSIHGDGEQILQTEVSEENWLNAEFITNPLDATFDYYFGLTTAPIVFKYHGPAARIFMGVFRRPRSVRIKKLVTNAPLEAAKARSLSSLKYAATKNPRLKLKVSFAPTIIIFAKGGSLNENAPTLVGKLGSLNIDTVDKITAFNIGENMKKDTHQDIMSKAYMKIHSSMSDIQLCFADNFRTCMNALTNENSHYHLIKPLRMDLIVCRATFKDFPIPRYHVFCQLPKVCANISDERLTKLLDLLLTFPRPIPSTDSSNTLYDVHMNTSVDAHIELTCVDESLSAKEDLKGIKPNKTPIKAPVAVPSNTKMEPKRQVSEMPDSQFCIFEFKIREISLLLFSRKLQKIKAAMNKVCFATFCSLNFTNIGFNGYITHNGYCLFKLRLRTLTLDDMREGVCIRRLLEKKEEDTSATTSVMDAPNPFAELLFEKNRAGVKRLEFSSSIFYLMLSPEFIGALSKFVVMPENMSHSETAIIGRPKDTVSAFKKMFHWCIKSGEKNLDTQTGSLSLKCVIKQIEVYLVEDAFKPDDSLALILSFNAALDAKIDRANQFFDGSIQDLQITSTYFKHHRRKEYSYAVLPKTNLSVGGSFDEFKVKLGRIELSVSAVVIRLIKSLVAHIFGDKTAESMARKVSPFIRIKTPQSSEPAGLSTLDWRTPSAVVHAMNVIQGDKKKLGAERALPAKSGHLCSFLCYSLILVFVSLISISIGYVICSYF